MARQSAGILLYKKSKGDLFVFLVHPGGPFFAKKDLGAWSIPKGEFLEGENPEAVARREFAEELGVELTGPLQPLGQLRQRGGKTVIGYAAKGALDVANVRSNQVPIEWPPRTGRIIHIPEIDRAAWFDLPLARKKILASQQPFLDRLKRLGRDV